MLSTPAAMNSKLLSCIRNMEEGGQVLLYNNVAQQDLTPECGMESII
jgi:hypothetical protein